MRASDESDIEYPLLGEPPVVEFINTLYIDADGTFDFLATIGLARGWFAALRPTVLSAVGRIDEAARRDFVELRSAIRAVTDARHLTEAHAPIAVLESAVNAVPGRIELRTAAAGLVTVHTRWDLDSPAAAAACLARAAIDVIASASSGPIRVCDRPACNMRYLQQHRRRRYCNPACANSDRQTRFQERHKK